MKNLLVTGGAGFIGSHLVRRLVTRYRGRYRVVNADCLTYAGNLENLRDIEKAENYVFRKYDIRDRAFLNSLFSEFNFAGVFHLAAESHVDRSIEAPAIFVETNVLGTLNLLDAARLAWDGDYDNRCFCHISTDEVFGSLSEHEEPFHESTPYSPQSPYAASKAGADHLVRAYHNTHNLPVKLTNCSNNYGSHQFPEKLIPLCISKLRDRRAIPVYGDGSNIRDWLHVDDHVSAIDLVFHHGRIGHSYNIGGDSEVRNIDLVRKICQITDRLLGQEIGCSEKLIKFVADRPGHDHRYAINFSKIQSELGWRPEILLDQGLTKTIQWYLENDQWIDGIHSGRYREAAQRISL
jgi:dTDP-glucose 4,6-dehydratase